MSSIIRQNKVCVLVSAKLPIYNYYCIQDLISENDYFYQSLAIRYFNSKLIHGISKLNLRKYENLKSDKSLSYVSFIDFCIRISVFLSFNTERIIYYLMDYSDDRLMHSIICALNEVETRNLKDEIFKSKLKRNRY